MTKTKEKIYVLKHDSKYGFTMVFTVETEVFLSRLAKECRDKVKKEIREKYKVDLYNDMIPLPGVECKKEAIKVAEGISEIIGNLINNDGFVICPKCQSKRIFKYRLDSDWTMAGDYYPMNSDEFYSKEELNYDSYDKPDIEIYHCLDCKHLFE